MFNLLSISGSINVTVTKDSYPHIKLIRSLEIDIWNIGKLAFKDLEKVEKLNGVTLNADVRSLWEKAVQTNKYDECKYLCRPDQPSGDKDTLCKGSAIYNRQMCSFCMKNLGLDLKNASERCESHMSEPPNYADMKKNNQDSMKVPSESPILDYEPDFGHNDFFESCSFVLFSHKLIMFSYYCLIPSSSFLKLWQH